MKKYSIIKDEEGEVRVVPSNWLTDDKESVYWPPYKDSARVKSAAINLESRNSDWELYSCTFIKSNDDYVDAQKEARFPNFDDLTDASDEERLKATRAARNKITASPSKFISSFTKVKPPKIWETNNSVDGSKSTEGISPKKVLLAKNSVKNAPLLKSLQVDLQRTISPAQKSLFPRSEFLTGGPSGNSVVNDSSQEEEDGSNNEVELEITLPMIFEMQKTMVTKLNSLGIKVDNLSKKLQRCQNIRVADKEIVASQDMIESMSKIFPMTNEIPERSMDGVNEKIRTDPTFRKELVLFFKSKGGADIHRFIYNILPAAMTNKVANKYSYVGHKKKHAFKDLPLCTVIYKSVRHLFPSSQDEEIRSSISSWLDQSGTRLKRESDTEAAGSKKRRRDVKYYIDLEENVAEENSMNEE
ncbi:uncharacterized protein LOC131673781 [Phymastichus coffea]|uniref:uncharacterized protein LOC131673781 n=1 Tax=Phymastichus coffea TaxID=108790 RepID=UPI00273A8104|nr:uncharacterized protein LOC131673781 [Phymastichus coffea]